MAAPVFVDVSEMPQHPRSDRPRDDEARGPVPDLDAADLDAPDLDAPDLDDLLDEDEDPRVAALLGVVTTRLRVPPDELTRHRHLAAMRAATGRGLLLRVAQRTGVAAAAALVLGGVLAGGGWLPDPIQREVADAAAQVGIELPRPEAREQVVRESDAPDVPPTDGELPADADTAREGEPTVDADEPRTEDGRPAREGDGDATVGDGDAQGEDRPGAPLPDDAADLLDPDEVEPDGRRHIVPIEPPIRPPAEERDEERLRGPEERGDRDDARDRERWLTEDDEDDRPDGGVPGADG
jgi:hypothetical protein